MNFKKLLAAVLACGMLAAMTGCNPKETISSLQNEMQAGGREHSKDYSASGDEALSNAFFEYKINSAQLFSSVEDYLPDAKGRAFLVVDVTIKNIFQDDTSIPMSPADFELSWTGNTGEYEYPVSNFGLADQLPDEWTQLKGNTKTGKIVFFVPDNVESIDLIYREIYEDNFEGNKYVITYPVDRSTFVPLTEEELAMME